MDKKSFQIGISIGFFITLIFSIYMFSKMHKIIELKNIDINSVEILSLNKEKVFFNNDKPTIINF